MRTRCLAPLLVGCGCILCGVEPGFAMLLVRGRARHPYTLCAGCAEASIRDTTILERVERILEGVWN